MRVLKVLTRQRDLRMMWDGDITWNLKGSGGVRMYSIYVRQPWLSHQDRANNRKYTSSRNQNPGCAKKTVAASTVLGFRILEEVV